MILTKEHLERSDKKFHSYSILTTILFLGFAIYAILIAVATVINSSESLNINYPSYISFIKKCKISFQYSILDFNHFSDNLYLYILFSYFAIVFLLFVLALIWIAKRKHMHHRFEILANNPNHDMTPKLLQNPSTVNPALAVNPTSNAPIVQVNNDVKQDIIPEQNKNVA